MKRKILIVAFVVFVLSSFTFGSALAKTNRGVAPDPNYPQLGDIKYLSNPVGYHFWFTPTDDLGPYVAGHSYHNVYKFKVGDPSKWCGPVVIPDREPYNLVGPVGAKVYYKIWDTTTDTLVCP